MRDIWLADAHPPRSADTNHTLHEIFKDPPSVVRTRAGFGVQPGINQGTILDSKLCDIALTTELPLLLFLLLPLLG